MTNLLKYLGSLSFTIVLCVMLMVLLVVSTSMESLYGTSWAQKIFYQARWFDVLLSFLWINIFCSTALRFPFQKCHRGFLITHIGILGLLLGALLTRLYGLEGQVVLYEGESSHQMQTGGHELSVRLPDQENLFFDMAALKRGIQVGKTDLSIKLDHVVENAIRDVQVHEGSTQDPKNLAMSVEMKSSTVDLNGKFWLIERNPDNPQSNLEQIGPAKIMLLSQAPGLGKQGPLLKFLNIAGEEVGVFDLTKSQINEYSISKTGYRVKNIKYYPYAKVSGNALMNAEGSSYNPAVEFDLVDGQGQSVHYVKFALYPDFESIHGKTAQAPDDVLVRFEADKEDGHDQGATSLLLYPASQGVWKYHSTSKDGAVKEGDLVLDQWLSAGWMDITFRIRKVVEHAQITYDLKKSTDTKNGVFAAEVVVHDGEEKKVQWLTENQEADMTTSQGAIKVGLTPRKVTLPFLLTLNDFRKVDYPGTNNPASFESDVVLEDFKKKFKITQTISMNKPMDYEGYRIFQSSYIQNSSSGEASIFTVTKNPGISFIYLSSCLIFLGAFLQFYVKGFSKNQA